MEHEIRALIDAMRRRIQEQERIFEEALLTVLHSVKTQDAALERMRQMFGETVKGGMPVGGHVSGHVSGLADAHVVGAKLRFDNEPVGNGGDYQDYPFRQTPPRPPGR